MRLILTGCEYSGTTTLAHAINDWAEKVMGARFPLIHDHYKIPHVSGHPPNLTPEQQEQAFKEFFRGTNAQQVCGGTGMGLSIVKEIVDELGGSIVLSSTVDKGTTVIVTLPAKSKT